MLGKRAVNEAKFKPDLFWVEKQLNKILEITDDQIVVELAAEMSINGKIRPEFICVICQNVAWAPRECEECEIIACGRCIDEWWLHSENCPSCKNEQGFKLLNRNLRNQLLEY